MAAWSRCRRPRAAGYREREIGEGGLASGWHRVATAFLYIGRRQQPAFLSAGVPSYPVHRRAMLVFECLPPLAMNDRSKDIPRAREHRARRSDLYPVSGLAPQAPPPGWEVQEGGRLTGLAAVPGAVRMCCPVLGAEPRNT